MNLEKISDYVKSVVAATIGEIMFAKLPNEDGTYGYLEKKDGYDLCQKALDVSWEWIERKNIDKIDPWSFCSYLDDEDGIDFMSYEDDTVKVGDIKSANVYAIMNCIILYIAFLAFLQAEEMYFPCYLSGIDDEFYAEGILNFAMEINCCNVYEILDYCNKKLERNSNYIFHKEEMINTFLQDK